MKNNLTKFHSEGSLNNIYLFFGFLYKWGKSSYPIQPPLPIYVLNGGYLQHSILLDN